MYICMYVSNYVYVQICTLYICMYACCNLISGTPWGEGILVTTSRGIQFGHFLTDWLKYFQFLCPYIWGYSSGDLRQHLLGPGSILVFTYPPTILGSSFNQNPV